MKKIDIRLANQCINAYESTMKKFGVDTPSKGFTKSVGFNKKELLDWVQKLGDDTQEIKIYFGVYPSHSAAADQLRKEESTGRFTTILWPCNSEGEPAEDEEGNEELPVNVGELKP